MKLALKILAYSLLSVLLVVATMTFMHAFAVDQSIGEIRYVDVITIVLTALSIMITILGLFVAVLGIVGWATFESKIRDNSLSYLTSELSKDGKLRKEFEAILTELSLQGVRPEDGGSRVEGLENSGPERPYND